MSDFNNSLVSFLIYHVPHQQTLSLSRVNYFWIFNYNKVYNKITIVVYFTLYNCIPNNWTTPWRTDRPVLQRDCHEEGPEHIFPGQKWDGVLQKKFPGRLPWYNIADQQRLCRHPRLSSLDRRSSLVEILHPEFISLKGTSEKAALWDSVKSVIKKVTYHIS